jgi:predicted RNA binding protein YcfA (HicA-like mRNA interferase family)
MPISGRSPNLEAFTGPELSEFLTSKCGARFLQQKGSHLTYELPNGTQVGSLTVGNHVPTPMARAIAKQLGMTYVELRAALRRPVIKRTKRSHTPVKRPTDMIGKADIVWQLDRLRDDLAELEALRFGDRDPDYYRNALTYLVAAREELGRLPRPLGTWRPKRPTQRPVDVEAAETLQARSPVFVGTR